MTPLSGDGTNHTPLGASLSKTTTDKLGRDYGLREQVEGLICAYELSNFDLAECAFFIHNNAQRMPRTEDNAKGLQLRIQVSEQINDALNQIADSGYIGHNRIDVAYRFIQDGVLAALDNPHFQKKKQPTKR